MRAYVAIITMMTVAMVLSLYLDLGHVASVMLIIGLSTGFIIGYLVSEPSQVLQVQPGQQRAEERELKCEKSSNEAIQGSSTGAPESHEARCHVPVYLPGPVYLPVVEDLIRSAQERVGIAMYVVKPGRLVQRLIDAVVESRATTKLVVLESEDRGERLVENREVVDYLRRHGVDARLAPGRNTQHLKVVVADDWVVIGSHNWTDRALSSNDEVSIAIRDRELADRAMNDILRIARGEKIGDVVMSYVA